MPSAQRQVHSVCHQDALWHVFASHSWHHSIECLWFQKKELVIHRPGAWYPVPMPQQGCVRCQQVNLMEHRHVCSNPGGKGTLSNDGPRAGPGGRSFNRLVFANLEGADKHNVLCYLYRDVTLCRDVILCFLPRDYR